MQDLYLKFSDEAEAKSVLYSRADTELRPNYRNIDVPATPLDGWHVNVRLVDGEDAAALEPFAVTPSSPRRVWG